LRILVDAAVALDLLQWQGDRIIWGPQGAALVAQPWIMGFVKHHAHFYRDLTDPVTLIKGDAKGQAMKGYWSYQDEGSDKLGYSQLMAQSQAAVSGQVLGAYDFRRHYRVLDVGGGTGAFLSAIGAAHPQLELNLFDLPGVVALVDDPKIARHAGDFRLDALPRAMDLITLVRVVHDHDDDVVLQLLRNIRKSCSANTTLLIAEPMAGTKSTAAVTDAYFNLYFAAMGQGRTRTPEAISALAGQAGFAGMKTWATDMPLIANVITFRQIGNEL
jgi:demethylspheroidene O-methyltransferase